MDPWATSASDPFAVGPPQPRQPHTATQSQHAQQPPHRHQAADPFAQFSLPPTTSVAPASASAADPFAFTSPFPASLYPPAPQAQPHSGGPPPGVGQYAYAPYNPPQPYVSSAASSAWPTSAPPARQPPAYGGSSFDPFGGPAAAPPPSAYYAPPSSSQQAPYSQYSAFNPFDVANDPPSFYPSVSSPPPPSQPSAHVAAPPEKTYQPPTVEQQRLIRTASLLFEHGFVIKTDKTLLQDLVLAGHRKVGPALDAAERNRDTKGIGKILAKARKREEEGKDLGVSSSDEDVTDVFAGDETSVAGGAGGSSYYEGGEDFTRRDSVLQTAASKGGEQEAPHPAAGGFNAALPSGMKLEKSCLTGHVLMRVSSKKMFRKWKLVFFALDKSRLTIFDDRRSWEFQGFPKASFELHECSWIGRPSLKTSSSLIEGGFMEKARPVYCSWLKENPPNLVGSWNASGMERPKAFSHALEERILAKFAAYELVDISAFAYAIFGVITAKQKSAKR